MVDFSAGFFQVGYVWQNSKGNSRTIISTSGETVFYWTNMRGGYRDFTTKRNFLRWIRDTRALRIGTGVKSYDC